MTSQATDWLLRVGGGKNFKNSSKFGIWGIKSSEKSGSYFKKNVKTGDRLWYVVNASGGKVIGVSTYSSHNDRELGPHFALSLTNKHLGWTGGEENNWDTEIRYTDLYEIEHCNLLTSIKSPLVIRKYNEKCQVDLPTQYKNIIRYVKKSKIV